MAIPLGCPLPAWSGGGRCSRAPPVVSAVVDGLLGRLGARHELGLAGRLRDGGLLLAAPGDGRYVEHEDDRSPSQARGGVLHSPVRVGHAVEREVVALVGQAEIVGRNVTYTVCDGFILP